MKEICEQPTTEKMSTLSLETNVREPSNISELIKHYDEIGLGRGFIVRNKFGENELVGYAIPSKLDGLGHLMIFTSGKMIFVEPEDQKPGTISSYQRFFSPKDLPYIESELESHPGLGRELMFALFFPDFDYGRSNVTDSNINGQSDEFNTKVSNAKAVAYQLREQRLAGIQSSEQALLNPYNHLFTPVPEQSPLDQTFEIQKPEDQQEEACTTEWV